MFLINMKMERVIISTMIPVQFIFLVFQFLLGMWINLFAPSNMTPTTGRYMMYMFTVPGVMVHIMLGIIIGIVSILLFIFSVFYGRIFLILMSFAGSLSIIVAGLSGIYFLIGGMSNNVLSYIMATCFIFSVSVYFAMTYSLQKLP